MKWKLFSHVWLFATSWTVAHHASLPLEFSRQEYWSGLPFPSPGDLADPRIESGSPALQANSLPSEPLYSIPPFIVTYILLINQQATINSTFLIFFWISKITGNGYLIRKLLIKEIFFNVKLTLVLRSPPHSWETYHKHLAKLFFFSTNSLAVFGFCKKRLRAEPLIFNLFLIELSKKTEMETPPTDQPWLHKSTFSHFMVGATGENSKKNYGSFIILCQSLSRARGLTVYLSI